jgi:hypothetical protein
LLQIPWKSLEVSATTLFLSESLAFPNALSCARCLSFQTVSQSLYLAAAAEEETGGAVLILSGIFVSSYSSKMLCNSRDTDTKMINYVH